MDCRERILLKEEKFYEHHVCIEVEQGAQSSTAARKWREEIQVLPSQLGNANHLIVNI